MIFLSVPFYHIFDKDSVGQLINPLPLNQILKWAGQAPTAQTEENKPKILFLGLGLTFFEVVTQNVM